jgi:hypothetical protein
MKARAVARWVGWCGLGVLAFGGVAGAGCGSDASNAPGTDAGADSPNVRPLDAGDDTASDAAPGDGGSNVDADADAGFDAGTTPCEIYCNTLAANCSGANAMYTSIAGCELACAALPAGTPGDTSGDTLACRAHYAALAAGDATQCTSAGPFGITGCESTTLPNKACEAFCTIAQAVCTGTNKQFADVPTCMSNCQGNPAMNVPVTANGPATGMSFECAAHFLITSLDDPVTLCPHIVAGHAPCF